jgi:glycosyltransferase involved in cell wall biosynthesis
LTTENDKVRVSIVVPCYNEELGVGDVILGLHSAMTGAGLKPGEDFEIIVVDDGSGDGSAAAAEKAGARVLRHPCNRGYGRSLLTGFAAARFPWVLMIDGDGSYPPQAAADLLPYAPRFDMIVGARRGTHFWGSPLQAFLRTIYLVLAGFAAGEDIPDANSGLRLIRKEAFDNSMPILCYGYSLSTTMTLSFIQGGRFVKFLPIDYLARMGNSKVRKLRDIPRTLQIMMQVMIYYNPLKFAVFLALLIGLISSILVGPLFGVCSAFLIYFWGCVLDSIRLNRAS